MHRSTRSDLAITLQAIGWMHRLRDDPAQWLHLDFLAWCAYDARHCEELVAVLRCDRRLDCLRGMRVDPGLLQSRTRAKARLS